MTDLTIFKHLINNNNYTANMIQYFSYVIMQLDAV